MLPNLPRSARPRGALAVVTQSKQSFTTKGPRGMALDQKYTKKRTHYGPAACTSPHVGTLLKGFLSTRMLCHSTTPGETVFFLKAENAELVHAASGQPSFDDSLPARAIGVTLLIYGDESTCSASARTYLDAMGHFAASHVDETDPSSPLVASTMRLTVLAGDDAVWFVRQVEKESITSAADIGAGKIDVCMRWAADGGKSFRTELSSMRVQTCLSVALVQVQNFLLSMKLIYQAPIHDDITRSHSQIAPDAWAHTLHDATAAFFAKMEGTPCVVKSPLLTKHEQEATVESMDIFLRIAPRRCWNHADKQWVDLTVEMAMGHPDAFHAFLVGNSGYSEEILKFCQTNSATGLPLSDHDSEVYLLHTCAVQAAALHLMHEVSLYGGHAATGRLPGVPIAQPGSMVWRFDPAIVPLDVVVRDFFVVPCSRSSVMPADPKLERPFTQFFDRAFRLYTSFVSGSGNAQNGLTRTPSLPILTSEPSDPAMQTCEMFALNAFGLDLRAPNLTAGDAYSHLKKCGGPQQLQHFMLASCVQSGVNASVLTALEAGASALQQLQGARSNREEDEHRRLKRVADESLKVVSRTARRQKSRPISPAVELNSQQVKHLLSTIGLVKGKETVIHYQDMITPDAFTRVVDVVASCVAPSVSEEARVHAAEAARSAARKSVLGAIGIATCVLRSFKGVKLAPVFVVAQTLSDNGDQHPIRFARVLPCGNLEDATAGVIVDTQSAAVLLIRFGKSVRLTATVRG